MSGALNCICQVPNDDISFMVLWTEPKMSHMPAEGEGGNGVLENARWSHFLFRQYNWLNWIPSAPTNGIGLTCILKDNETLFQKNRPEQRRKQLHQSEWMTYGCISSVCGSSAKCQRVFFLFVCFSRIAHLNLV